MTVDSAMALGRHALSTHVRSVARESGRSSPRRDADSRSDLRPTEARRWFHRWRMFFLAVAELFGYANGNEWFVSHSLLQPNGRSLQ